MADWMADQISDPDEGNDSESVESKSGDEEFASQLMTMVATDSVEKLAVDLLEDRVPDVEDVEALRSAYEQEERDEAIEVYEDRLDDLGELGDLEEDASKDAEEEETADTDTEETTESPFDADDSDTDEETDEESSDDETEDDSEGAEEPADPFGDSEEKEDQGYDTSDEDDDASASEPPAPDPSPGEAVGDGGTQSNEATVDVKSIAPDVITAEDAADRDPRFTMLVWADPGQGKTHFACTGPEPVVIIDTEGKADEVAAKFHGEGEVPESPFIFQPTDYDEAREALDSALDILDEFRTKADMTGTLVVDSMSVMWGWSQQKYVEKFYPGKDAEEVEFSSAIGGGQSDWKQIKRYHNVKFRQIMLDSPYHLIWTAMREDDYEEQMKGNRDADKPAGEKENPYKVDEVLRIQEGPDGAPVGVLNKSGKIKHRYAGLRYPTFDKHRDLIDSILDAENGSRSVAAVQGEAGVEIHEGNPEYKDGDDE